MEREVVGDEAGDEVVRVIVALLQCMHAGAYVDHLGWASEASSLRRSCMRSSSSTPRSLHTAANVSGRSWLTYRGQSETANDPPSSGAIYEPPLAPPQRESCRRRPGQSVS